MLPNWNDRPTTVAYLLNPVFCGEILRRFLKEYEKNTNDGAPFQLLFIVIPIILNKRIRLSLPKTTNKNLYTWISENQFILHNIHELIRNTIPYTKEGLMFMLSHKLININQFGHFVNTGHIKSINEEDETNECLKKAELLGKWLGKSGSIQLIFISLGIKLKF